MSSFFNTKWVMVTAMLFSALYLYLLPRLIERYGLAGTLALIPVFALMGFLAYLRGYWVSTLFRRQADKRNRREGHSRLCR